jgi:large subunit ribosomal protein L5
MFPEIEYDKIDRIRGMDISIVTNSSTDQEGLALLKAFGMPFKNQ